MSVSVLSVSVVVTGVSVVDMAQDVLQVLGMWHGAQHEELQRLS